MALKAGYKGFKKLLSPLKLFRPGELGIDQDALVEDLNPVLFSLQNATSLLTAEENVTINNVYKAKSGNIVTYAVVLTTTAEKATNSTLVSGWDAPEPLNDGIMSGFLYASGTMYKVAFTISNSKAILQARETIPNGASLRGTFTYITKAAAAANRSFPEATREAAPETTEPAEEPATKTTKKTTKKTASADNNE